VTTLSQLVVVDMTNRKVIESIDLLGNVQGLDISAKAKFLAIAPIAAQYLYKVDLDWKSVDDIKVERIKFKADSNEPGVFSVGVGADDSILFTTTFSGSGGVKLRRMAATGVVTEVGRVNMDSVIAVTGDRQKAYIAEGNISSGRLDRYDFKKKLVSKVTDMQSFNYELAASADGAMVARPRANGCELYDANGSKLGNLTGGAVIAAAFNPKGKTLFVFRSGQQSIQEYSQGGKLLDSAYPIDRNVAMKGDARRSIVGQQVGNQVRLRSMTTVTNHTYANGRLHVSEDGSTLMALVGNDGVFVFPIGDKAKDSDDAKPPKSKVKIIDK
jgi:hypothetical protein